MGNKGFGINTVEQHFLDCIVEDEKMIMRKGRNFKEKVEKCFYSRAGSVAMFYFLLLK